MRDLITVKVYQSRTEAEIDRGLLHSQNIDTIIESDDAGGMRSFPFSYSYGVKLKVHPKQLSEAKKLLSVS
jgi:hypothetical protein